MLIAIAADSDFNMDKLTLVCLLFVIACQDICSAADKCDSGRVFVGSVNESFPLQVHRNGIYIQQPQGFQDRPIYKHEDRAEYLYYTIDVLGRGYWVIGTAEGASTIGMRVRSEAMRPEAATETWDVRIDDTDDWASQIRLKAICVDDSFGPCSSGELTLSGLSRFSRLQHNLQGSYTLMNITHQLRPVYRHDSLDEYMFHMDGLWMIGGEVGKASAGLFALDFASRPEYIIQPWVAFTGHDFITESKLKVQCQVETTAESNRPSCTHMESCSAKGQCVAYSATEYVCRCDEGYIGANCEQLVTCGLPDAMPHGHIKRSTGTAYLAWTFYGCETGYAPIETNAIVCGVDGQWTKPVTCSAGDFSNSPAYTMIGPWGRK